jgi:pyroglutamyl-peptidase
MPSVLITAFEPYDHWPENSSWLTMVELTKYLPDQPKVTTRLYPVDFVALREKLAADLSLNFDYALHLGQNPGSGRIVLEAVGINVGGPPDQMPDAYEPLVKEGPVAYRSPLPLAAWAAKLRRAGIPAQVSYSAGTYLCNATLYLSHYLAEQQGLKTRCALVHLPLETSQVVAVSGDAASFPRATLAGAIRLVLDELATEPC